MLPGIMLLTEELPGTDVAMPITNNKDTMPISNFMVEPLIAIIAIRLKMDLGN